MSFYTRSRQGTRVSAPLTCAAPAWQAEAGPVGRGDRRPRYAAGQGGGRAPRQVRAAGSPAARAVTTHLGERLIFSAQLGYRRGFWRVAVVFGLENVELLPEVDRKGRNKERLTARHGARASPEASATQTTTTISWWSLLVCL